MRKIRDVLRLKLEARLSHENTAAALDISKGVISKYLTLVTAAGLDWNHVQLLDDTALPSRLLGAPQRTSGFVQTEYGRMHQELRRKSMTLMLLWEEHRTQHSGQTAHSYSQFCENLTALRQEPQALHAPDPPRRREAVYRLRRAHAGAH